MTDWKSVQVIGEQFGYAPDLFLLGDSSGEKMEGALAPYCGQVQLVYLDPPFFTGQQFTYLKRGGIDDWKANKGEKVALYSDKWTDLGAYLAFLERALLRVRDLLSPDGSVYLHIDDRAMAHARLLMDRIFGADRFMNDIIWHYQSGGRALNHYSRKHDHILLYSAGKKPYFNPAAAATPRGPERRNHLKREVAPDGRVFFSIRSGGKRYVYFEDDPIFPDDVWSDIAHLQQRDPERVGYDTQKPVALLDRILSVSSEPGALVADLFAGSGTTGVSARRRGRRFLLADRSAHSLGMCRMRLMDGGFRARYIDPPPSVEGRARINKTPRGIELLAYDTGGSPPSHSLLPDWADLMGWAAGKVENGIFFAHAYSHRSMRAPALLDRLDAPDSDAAFFIEPSGASGAIQSAPSFGKEDES